MDRRQLITGAAALTTLMTTSAHAATTESPRTFLELTTWRLHNSDESQATRLAAYLETGLFPAITRAGSRPVAAFANLIGPDGPYTVTLTQYASLDALQRTLASLAADPVHQTALQQLSSGPGSPFVSVESSILHSLDILPEPVLPASLNELATVPHPPRIFELRTYQNQSFLAQQKKAAMFNHGEIAIFQRLGMRPVFIGEAILGPRLPNITYMLAFDNLDAREKLWKQFSADPAWKQLSAPPELKDPQIVANISNTILRPLPFSPLR
jgi:hypothetical protein